MAEPDRLLALADGSGGWASCGLWWRQPGLAHAPIAPAANPGESIGRIGRLAASGPTLAAELLSAPASSFASAAVPRYWLRLMGTPGIPTG